MKENLQETFSIAAEIITFFSRSWSIFTRMLLKSVFKRYEGHTWIKVDFLVAQKKNQIEI